MCALIDVFINRIFRYKKNVFVENPNTVFNKIRKDNLPHATYISFFLYTVFNGSEVVLYLNDFYITHKLIIIAEKFEDRNDEVFTWIIRLTTC